VGAFNEVTGEAVCPACGTSVSVCAQFKYGDKWQFEYSIGDTLRWGGNDEGVPGRRSVVVDAIASSPCPECGSVEEWNLYLFVECDRLIRLKTADGTHDFVGGHAGHIVLEP